MIIDYVLKYIDVALVLGEKLTFIYENIVKSIQVAPVGTDFMINNNFVCL